jgi:predicted ATPase
MAQLLERGDGIPLFVEELARALSESPLSQYDAGSNDLPEPLSLPTTLRDLLMARMDQLDDAKDVLQVGAVLGRGFSARLLGAVTARPMVELQDALRRLEQAALILRRGSGTETRYEFRHALLREAANDSLLHSSRQALHRRIAQVLESDYPQFSAKQPEQLARHFSEAGMAEKAVEYWLQAGRRASEQSANPEAVSHLRQGLKQLPHLTDHDRRQRWELELLAVLGPVLIVTQGPATAEVSRVYSRALELCSGLPESPLHFAVLWGWSRISANYGIKRERAERMLSLARQLGDPGLELQAHHSLWASLFHLGQLQLCHQHIQQGLSLYAGGDYRWHAAIYGGHDPCVCAEGEAAQALWLMGHPDQAVERSHAALARAEELAHSGSIVHAMDMALLVHHYRRDPLAVKVHAQRLSDYAEAHGFPEYRAKSRIFLAWAEALLEGPELGLEPLREAIDAHRGLGTREDFQVFSTMLAELHAAVDQPEAGLAQIDQALAEGRGSGLCFWEAELHRCRGELLLQLSVSGAEDGLACFQRALGVARIQQALSLELRAVTSLADWWRKQGQARKARLLLEPVYRRFSEGLDSADLQDARRMLESLG